MEQQKKINILLDQFLQTSDNLSDILTILSSRVDMPKQFVQTLSKRLNTKNWIHLNKLFQLLQLVSLKFQGGISLFTQISNKQFLFKITSILNMKDIPEKSKKIIVDTVFCWKKLFKPYEELLPAFLIFIKNFQSKGYVASNSNFETTTEMNLKTSLNTKNQQDLINLKSSQNSSESLKKLDKTEVQFFRKFLQRLINVNKIISHTDHEMLDFPPIIKQEMALLKKSEIQLNKIINDSKSEKSLEIALSLTDTIRFTQKRYNDLITRYMPQKFELTRLLKQFAEVYPPIQKKQNIGPNADLLDLMGQNQNQNILKASNNNNDLIDLSQNGQNLRTNVIPSQAQSGQSKIQSFFNGILGNSSQNSVGDNKMNSINFGTISLQQSEFRTDMDFKQYDDTPAVQKLTKKLTDLADFKFTDVFEKKQK